MKAVQHLLSGQYLSTAYDFYTSGLFKKPDAAMVGTSMVSANNIYCGHLSINGSLGLFIGQMPDRLWGQIWCTPAASQGLSVTQGGMAPEVVYTVLLDASGVLNVQAAGATIWKSPGPADASAGSYFAQITDDGQLTLNSGSPANPGSRYWSSGTNQGTLYIDRQAGMGYTNVQLSMAYFDARGGKPGNLVKLSLGTTSASNTVHWPAMLADATDPAYLASMPRALCLNIGPGEPYLQQINIGAWRSLRMVVTNQGCEFPQGFGHALSA